MTNNQAYINVTGSTNLVLKNAQFINNGNFNAGMGTVTILGDSSDVRSAIGGDSTTTFYNLQLNKTTNGSQLQRPIQVDNELRMTSGNLDLNGNNLALGSASGTIVDEKESSRITGPAGGVVTKTITASSLFGVNPGNIGVSLTTASHLGILTIRRGHVAQVLNDGSPQTKGIDRYFEFDAVNNAALNLSAQIQYFDAELSNGNLESNLGYWRRDSSFWFNPFHTFVNTTTNIVFVDSINLLSRWTLANEGFRVSPKVYLEGNYSTTNGLMNDALRANNLLPTRSPYTSPNYNNGMADGTESIHPLVLTDASNDAIVDWVFVELRSTAAGNPVVYGRSALLQKDGDIVDLDGQSPVSFPLVNPGTDYYLAIRHRNHLGIRSLNPFTANTTPTPFDFTSNGNSVLGGTNGIKQLSDGSFALFSGDFSDDGQVQLAGDGTAILPFLGQSGYLNGDLDLNGQVQNTEIQFKLTPNLGRGAQFSY
ncbi:MAG: hypothetical protein AAFU03_01205 [Bacteroidota bacterium]